MPSLEGYVAFILESILKVKEEGVLKPKMFGAPFKYVPFVDTITNSITKALITCPQAANNATDWYILKVMMSPEQVLTAFQEGLLGKIIGDTPGWRYYGDMPLNAFSIELLHISIGPVGVEMWADNVLSCGHEHRTKGVCTGCSASCSTWLASVRYDHKEYCASCWHKYVMKKKEGLAQTEGVPEAMETDSH